MEETGKAAIIHPTGTGKSFIAFKLIEDHPEQVVCWLSPSEYIYRTQIENVRTIDPCFDVRGIRFFTYANGYYPKRFLSDEQVRKLDAIGISWSITSASIQSSGQRTEIAI